MCVLQESLMEDARMLVERKSKAGGEKNMLQEANKLTHRVRFLVEEVWLRTARQRKNNTNGVFGLWRSAIESWRSVIYFVCSHKARF